MNRDFSVLLPRVSVIIPTYNHRDLIIETLQSVFAQTFQEFEIIVINDGSPDDTAQLLQPYITSGRIRYIEQPNAGQATARNRAIAEARGDFIALLDDDDLWPPDKLQWQVDELLRNPDWCAVAGQMAFLRDGALEQFASGDSLQQLTVASLFVVNPIYSPGQVLMRRTAFEIVGGFDPSIWGCDDYDLWLRLARTSPLMMRGRCALHYRVHAANASRNRGRMLHNALIVLRKNLSLLAPIEQAESSRNAFRWLYYYVGSAMLRETDRSKTNRTRDAALVFRAMALPMLKDTTLAKAIIRDVLPSPLSRAAGVVHRWWNR